jgi:hypothetical protein
MYEYQTDNLTEEITQKIKLFTKENYFSLFSYMLTKKAKNFSAFKKVSSLVLSIDNLIKEKELKRKKKLNIQKIEEKKPKLSPWFYLMIYICNVSNKKKYINPRKNELNIEPLIYAYMTNFCHNKIKLLHHFSVHYHLNLNTLVKFYLDLCSNQIMLDKESLKDNENPSEIVEEKNHNNKEYYNRRKSKMKLNMKELRNNYPSSTKLNFKLQKSSSATVSPKKSMKLKISNLFDKKSKKDGKLIDYTHSFTRLFIGETDQKSVKERYLSNIVIKKVKELHLFNKNLDLSKLYLKKLYHKLFKNEEGIDNEMNVLLNKFKLDSKMVQNYQRNALSFDKKNDYYYDEDKEKLQSQLQKQINIYSKPVSEIHKSINYNKISKFSIGSPFEEGNNKILMKFRNSRDKLNINIKTNKHKSVLFNLSSDYNKRFSSLISRNGSKNISRFRLSMTNNSKNNSIMKSRLHPKFDVKINLKYSPISGFKLHRKINSMDNNNDIFINIRSKLNKENEHMNINNKKFIFRNSLDEEVFDGKKNY